MVIVDDENNIVEPSVLGSVAIKLPLPPSFMLTIWNNDEFFIKKYLSDTPGYYTTGDAGIMDDKGYLHIMTRTDDVINCAGHRLSAGRIEEVVNSHVNVVENACIALSDEIKSDVPFGFVVLAEGVEISEAQLFKEV